MRKILMNCFCHPDKRAIILHTFTITTCACHRYCYMHIAYTSNKHAEGSDKLFYGVLSSFLTYVK